MVDKQIVDDGATDGENKSLNFKVSNTWSHWVSKWLLHPLAFWWPWCLLVCPLWCGQFSPCWKTWKVNWKRPQANTWSHWVSKWLLHPLAFWWPWCLLVCPLWCGQFKRACGLYAKWIAFPHQTGRDFFAAEPGLPRGYHARAVECGVSQNAVAVFKRACGLYAKWIAFPHQTGRDFFAAEPGLPRGYHRSSTAPRSGARRWRA